jgi:hypothetical protein
MTTSNQTQTTINTLSVGDTVRFHYALSNIDGQLYTGRVIGPVKHSELWGDVVLIEPFVCDYHLPPRHVSLSRIVSIVATAASVVDAAPVKPVEAYGACVVPYVTGQDTLRAILDLSNEATAAELAGRQAEARSISKEHTRLYDAYMKALKAEAASWKTPLQSRQKADSSPSTASQSKMADTPAPLTQADGDTWLSRMRARELSFAKQAAKQWGIAPSDAPRQPAPVTVKPPRAMTPAEQASHDALQKMIDASRKAN